VARLGKNAHSKQRKAANTKTAISRQIYLHALPEVGNRYFINSVVLQPLRWCCVDCVIPHERDVRKEQHHTYMWREQAIIE